DGIKRAARDWAANAKAPAWLAHGADRLRAAERLLARPDLAANLEPTDRGYVRACQRLEAAGRRKARWALTAILTLLLGIIAGLVAFINQGFLFLPRSPPSAFSNSEGFVLSRRSCDQLTQCMQLSWCHRGESESTLGWHRPASFSRKTPPYGRKTLL